MADEQKKVGATRVFVAAVVALVAWAAFTAYMISRAGSAQEVFWTRLAWLFSSVEAVAFGAAGAIFGSSIHRERAENAEKRADEKADDAAKGKALASTLIADQRAAQTLGGGGTRGQSPATPDVLARHAELAKQLFPNS